MTTTVTVEETQTVVQTAVESRDALRLRGRLIGDLTAITDGQVLEWDTVTARFIPGAGGGGGGSGTVTSVALTVPTGEFSLTGSPITGAGTFAISKASIAANLVAAGPATGSAAAWGFRSLVAADIPGIPEAKLSFTDITTANATASLHGLLPKLSGNPAQFLAGDGSWSAPAGSGDALTSLPLSQFASTTSAQLAGVLSDETGFASGALAVFSKSPTIETPTIASFVNATHSHLNAAGGGTLTAAAVSAPGSSGDLVYNNAGAFGGFGSWNGTAMTVPGTLASSGPVFGSELVTNGSFTGSATGWTLGTGWAYGSNAVTHTPGDTEALSQTASFTAGLTYKVAYTVTGSTQGSHLIGLGDAYDSDGAGNGTFTRYIIAGSAHSLLELWPNEGDFDGTVDNISVTSVSPVLSLALADGKTFVMDGAHGHLHAPLILRPTITDPADMDGVDVFGLRVRLDVIPSAAANPVVINGMSLETKFDGGSEDYDGTIVEGFATSAEFRGSGTPPDEITGGYNVVTHEGSSTAPLVTGFWTNAKLWGDTTIAHTVWARAANIQAAVGTHYSFYGSAPVLDGGSLGTHVTVYSDDLAGVATHPYYLWADSRGVYRIREDNVADGGGNPQAVPALYNPRFTKYTAGATDYERGVQQWVGNVYQMGTEAGGTGTSRGVQIIGASLQIPVTHSAIGAETISGYIEVTDGGGTVRKLAVVS